MSHTPANCLDHKYRIETGFICIKCGYTRPSEEDLRLEELRQAKEEAWGQGAEAVALLIPEHEWHDRGLRLPTNPYRSQP